MKGTDKIIAHIQAEAALRADEIINAAKTKADGIIAEFEKEAADVYAKASENAKAEAASRLESAKRVCAMETKKQTLSLKQEMVSQVFDKAADVIISLPPDRYEAFLVKLVSQGMSSGNEELIFNEKDRAAYGEAVVKKINESKASSLTLSDKTADINGGVILRQGNIETNCSVKLLVDSMRSVLAADVVKTLFG